VGSRGGSCTASGLGTRERHERAASSEARGEGQVLRCEGGRGVVAGYRVRDRRRGRGARKAAGANAGAGATPSVSSVCVHRVCAHNRKPPRGTHLTAREGALHAPRDTLRHGQARAPPPAVQVHSGTCPSPPCHCIATPAASPVAVASLEPLRGRSTATHSLTHSLTHTRTHSLTHSLTKSP
jgi:hypothetical protein